MNQDDILTVAKVNILAQSCDPSSIDLIVGLPQIDTKQYRVISHLFRVFQTCSNHSTATTHGTKPVVQIGVVQPYPNPLRSRGNKDHRVISRVVQLLH